jgi:hypothetical protein
MSGEEFFQDLLPAVARLIQRDGIHFDKTRYWDNVLSPWAGRLRKPLLIKYGNAGLRRPLVCRSNRPRKSWSRRLIFLPSLDGDRSALSRRRRITSLR